MLVGKTGETSFAVPESTRVLCGGNFPTCASEIFLARDDMAAALSHRRKLRHLSLPVHILLIREPIIQPLIPCQVESASRHC